jgi:hypothetical protein
VKKSPQAKRSIVLAASPEAIADPDLPQKPNNQGGNCV